MSTKTAFAERMLPGTEKYYSERMLSILQGMAPRVWTPEGGEIYKLAEAEHEHKKHKAKSEKKEKSVGRHVAEGAAIGAGGLVGAPAGALAGAVGGAGLMGASISPHADRYHASLARGVGGLVGGFAGFPLGAGAGAGAIAGGLKANDMDESVLEGALRGGAGAGLGSLAGAAGGTALAMSPAYPGRYHPHPLVRATPALLGALAGGYGGYRLATDGIGEDKVASMLDELAKIAAGPAAIPVRMPRQNVFKPAVVGAPNAAPKPKPAPPSGPLNPGGGGFL